MSADAPNDLVATPASPLSNIIGMNKVFIGRLTAMMLLEYIVFGSWYATLGLVLATNGLAKIIGAAYSLGAVAAIVSPLCLGAVGDRVLPFEKLLGIVHLCGGVLMLFVPSIVTAGHGTLVLTFIFLYMICFMPTLGLTNSIGLRHLAVDERLFPYVRVFGTLGWVIAGVGVGALGLSASTGVFRVTGIASLFFAAYSFTLPSTPPGAKNANFSVGDLIGARAFALLRHRDFAVLMTCALLTSISLGVYNSYTSPYLGTLGISNVAGVMAIGQASEVLCIAAIPFVLARIGMKWALFLGMGMWGIRFSLFALASGGHAWMAILGVGLHGICSDFFLVLSAMYIDRVAPIELQAQAQNGLILVVSGFGTGIGSLIAGAIFAATVVVHPYAGPTIWIPLWLVPIGSAIVTGILWISLFPGKPAGPSSRYVSNPI